MIEVGHYYQWQCWQETSNRWVAPFSQPCAQELSFSPSKNAFPKSNLSQGHTGRFINLTVFVDITQVLKYTHETLRDLRLL